MFCCAGCDTFTSFMLLGGAIKGFYCFLKIRINTGGYPCLELEEGTNMKCFSILCHLLSQYQSLHKFLHTRKIVFKQNLSLTLAILIISILFHTYPAEAQSKPPVWQENLTCNQNIQKYKGLEFCTGLSSQANVVVIDLHDPDIHFEYVIAEGINRHGAFGPCQDVNIPDNSSGPGCHEPNNPSHFPVFSLFDAINRFPDAAIVINGDYGATNVNDRRHGPEGFTVVQGVRIDGPNYSDTDNNAVKRPYLAIGHNPLRVELNQLSFDDGNAPDWVYTGIGGAPWLIRDGIIQTEKINNCENANVHSCLNDTAQTAVGLSQDKRWLFFVLVKGENALGTAEFMKEELDVWSAIKLDGGGSSQIYYGGLPGDSVGEKTPYRGGGYWLSNYLSIFAQSGSGIEQSVPSTQMPTSTIGPLPAAGSFSSRSGTSWWEQFSKSFAGWSKKKIDGFGMGSSTHLRVGIDRYEEYLDLQQSLGVQWIREEFPWGEIEEKEGKFRFNYFFGDLARDFNWMLSSAAERNIKVVALLVYGPPPGLREPTEDQLLEYWREYVGAVVSQYGSQIDYWEIGNEMNSRKFWGKVVLPNSEKEVPPNPQLYAKMLSIAYEIIKQHDKNDVVILGGLITNSGDGPSCETNPFVYLKEIHDAGVWNNFDVIGFHPYWGDFAPEQPISRGITHNPDTGECISGERVDTLINEIRNLHHLTERFGYKPIWITELGWNQSELQNISNYRGSSPDQIEADYVARTYVPLLSEDGVEKVFWYTLVGDNSEQDFVLGQTGQQVYQNLSELLTGSIPLGQFQGQGDHNQPGDDDVYEYRFQKDNQTIIIIWKARGGEVKRDVVVSNLSWDTLRLYPIDAKELTPEVGTTLSVVDGKLTIKLNEHPLILVSEKESWWKETGNWINEFFSNDLNLVFQKWWEQIIQEIQISIEDWLQQKQKEAVNTIIDSINATIEQTCGVRPLSIMLIAGLAMWLRKHKVG